MNEELQFDVSKVIVNDNIRGCIVRPQCWSSKKSSKLARKINSEIGEIWNSYRKL